MSKIVLTSELLSDIRKYIEKNYIEETKTKYDALTDESDYSSELDYDGGKPHLCSMPSCNRAMSVPFVEPRARSLDECLDNLDKSFMEMVFSFADRKGISDAELQRRANIDKRAFSKLRCGNTKNPSKTTAFAFVIGLELGLDDAIDLLSRAGYAFSPSSRLDIIVKYFVENEAYDINVVNEVLYKYNESLLGSQLK